MVPSRRSPLQAAHASGCASKAARRDRGGLPLHARPLPHALPGLSEGSSPRNPPRRLARAPSSEPAGGGYFLTVATIEPRKNHRGLLRAFRAARAQGLDLRWKVAGAPGYSAEPILEELRAEPGVDVLGWVSDEELDRLYRGALFTAYPSLGEGFGIPPLESMARGVPVASSAGTGLDESVGEAGVKIECGDEGAWVETLLRLASDAGERERLRRLGLARGGLRLASRGGRIRRRLPCRAGPKGDCWVEVRSASAHRLNYISPLTAVGFVSRTSTSIFQHLLSA